MTEPLRIVVCDNLAKEGVDRLQGDPRAQVVVPPSKDRQAVLAAVADADGLIVRSSTQVDPELLARAPRLRAVVRAGVGVDNIDLDAATRRGVLVMNSPGGNTTSTAEHTLAMLMALARNVSAAHRSLLGKHWDRKSFMGTQLAGKTLGLVGLGRVGLAVARRAHALEMEILGCDPFCSEERAAECGVQLKDRLEDVLAHCDFLSVHTPLTNDTRGMIGATAFGMMKPGVRIINCARGGIVDEDALLGALDAGRVAGAALDVFQEEPPTDWRLATHPRVLCTPHLGASTEEAQVRVAIDAAQQMLDALTGGPVRYAVNLPAADWAASSQTQPYVQLGFRMGLVLAQLLEGRFRRAEVVYSGQIASSSTSSVTAAVIAGLLSNAFDETVNVVNARLLSREYGLEINEVHTDRRSNFLSLVEASVHTDQSRHVVAGTVFGQNLPRIVMLDDYHVEAIPEGDVLVAFNDDRPGLIGAIGNVCGGYGVNIARMTFGRQQQGGEAITVLNLDAPPPAELIAAIQDIPAVHRTRVMSLPTLDTADTAGVL